MWGKNIKESEDFYEKAIFCAAGNDNVIFRHDTIISSGKRI